MNSIFLGVLLVGVVHSAPNHLKSVYIEKNVAVGGGGAAGVGGGGAAASWGPFSASAGIGGSTGGAGASAGIDGGSSASASASASSESGGSIGGGHKGPGFFDQIFNIPISVLQSVNTHLNNKETQQALYLRRAQKQCRRHGNCKALEVLQASGGASAGASVGGSAGASASAGSSASADASIVGRTGASSDAGASSVGAVTVHKNYDTALAIPIAALTSVNQFLNGQGK